MNSSVEHRRLSNSEVPLPSTSRRSQLVTEEDELNRTDHKKSASDGARPLSHASSEASDIEAPARNPSPQESQTFEEFLVLPPKSPFRLSSSSLPAKLFPPSPSHSQIHVQKSAKRRASNFVGQRIASPVRTSYLEVPSSGSFRSQSWVTHDLPPTPPEKSPRRISLIGIPSSTDPRDLFTKFRHVQHSELSYLSDHDILARALVAGLIHLPPTGLARYATGTREGLRDLLEEFGTFTKFMEGRSEKIHLNIEDFGIKNINTRLWVRKDTKVERPRERVAELSEKPSMEPPKVVGNGLMSRENEEAQWTLWRDPQGVLRTRCSRKGRARTVVARTQRYPKKLNRIFAMSFGGRSVNKPWERHHYEDALSASAEDKDETAVEEKTLPKPVRVKMWGSTENHHCTLLNRKTILALRMYSQENYHSFMALIRKYKSTITNDICNNITRGPVFNAAMVVIALEDLVRCSLREYLPLEALQYVRDILYHYVSNQSLRVSRNSHVGYKTWRPKQFRTESFNARVYLANQLSGPFFQEFQEIIRRGYGSTPDERVLSGAAVTAVLYSSMVMALENLDEHNAKDAESVVRGLSIVFSAAESLVGLSPVKEVTNVADVVLNPLWSIVISKFPRGHGKGELKNTIDAIFRERWVVGALRGERIPGWASRKESDEAERLWKSKESKEHFDDEEEKKRKAWEKGMRKRRSLGRKYLNLVTMHVEALGGNFPMVKGVVDEEIDGII